MIGKTILITGANGFVGKNLVNRLRHDFSISCLVRDQNFKRRDTKVFYFNNYTDDCIEETVSQADIVIHCAAMLHGKKAEMFAANVNLTKTLLNLSEKHRIGQFVFLSTENVQQKIPDLYTETKHHAEEEVRKFKNHTILRPTVIYGPGDKKYVTKLINIIKSKPIAPVLGSGKNKFQFLYIDDLINVIKSAIQREVYGTYVIAGPESFTYNEFMSVLMKHLKTRKPIVRFPIFLLKPASYFLDLIFPFPPLTPTQLKNLVIDRDYDISDNVSHFDYKPTSLDAGLSQLIATEF